jgi:hypothetical protein
MQWSLVSTLVAYSACLCVRLSLSLCFEFIFTACLDARFCDVSIGHHTWFIVTCNELSFWTLVWFLMRQSRIGLYALSARFCSSGKGLGLHQPICLCLWFLFVQQTLSSVTKHTPDCPKPTSTGFPAQALAFHCYCPALGPLQCLFTGCHQAL